MKTPTDKFTSEMFGNRVGRPPKVHPKSAAERTRDWRNRKKTSGAKALDTARQLFKKPAELASQSDRNSICNWCGMEHSKCCGICSTGQLGHIEISHEKKEASL
jgi:hypothetical protein